MKIVKFLDIRKMFIMILIPILIFAPFSGSLKSVRAQQPENQNYRMADYINHTIQPGDTLWSIAKKYGVTVAEIMSANPGISEPGAIFAGQIVKIPQTDTGSGDPATETDKESVTYLFAGNTTSYLKTIGSTKGSVKTVNPDYFDITPEGSLLITPANKIDAAFITEMHRRKIKVVPFISNHWDRTLGNTALINRQALSTEIATAVEHYSLDGINIDIENVNEQYRDMYTDFARLLREKIPAEKEVTVAVAANPEGWNLGWHGSYDYNGLSKYCDYLMIMSYDESYYGGPAGPVSSAAFFENSIKYAINQNVEKEKIVAGLPFFGRYWKDGESVGGNGITFGDIEFLIKNYDSQLDYDEESKSAYARVTIKSGETAPVVWGGRTLSAGNYDIWYDNAESVEYKLGLINTYGIRGAGSWALGQEDISVWDFYTKVLNGISDDDINEPGPTGPEAPSKPENPLLPPILEPDAEPREPVYPNEDPFCEVPLPSPNKDPEKPGLFLPYPGKKADSFKKIQKIIYDAGGINLTPDTELSLGGFAVVLSELSHLARNDRKDFSDTAHWSRAQIEALISKKIVYPSYADTDPDSKLTRQELAVFLDSMLMLPDTVSLNSLSFSDITHRDEGFYPMAKLSFFGIMKSDKYGRFLPQSYVTMNEFAEIISSIENTGCEINPDKIIIEDYLGKLIVDPA